MKYLTFILIIIGLIGSIFILNFAVQEWNNYQQFRKDFEDHKNDFEEYKKVSYSQIELNRQNIWAILNFINNHTKK